MNRETPIRNAVREALVSSGRWIGWRNNVGVDLGHGVRYGLGLGSPDLVGALRGTGRMCCFETKAPKRGPDANQRMWHHAARAAGIFVAVVRSPDDALAALTRAEYGDSS